MTPSDADPDTPLSTAPSGYPEGGHPILDMGALAAEIRAAQPVPNLPDTDDMWDMDVDEIRSVFMRMDRNHGPAFLSELVDEGVLEGEAVAALVGHVWTMVEYPEDAAAYDEWVEWFRIAGEGRIVHDERGPIPAPTIVPTLYRGGKLCGRMSWTSSREVAEKFARGIAFRPADGTVWAVRDLPPELVLAHVDGRNEGEWVIDIQGYTGTPEIVW